MPVFDGCECWEVVSDNDYFFGIAISHSLFDEREVSLEFIVDILRNEPTFGMYIFCQLSPCAAISPLL